MRHRACPISETRLSEERANVRELYEGWLQRQNVAFVVCPSGECAHPACRGARIAEQTHRRIGRILWGSLAVSWFSLIIFGPMQVFIPGVVVVAMCIIWIPPLTQHLNRRPAAYAQLLYARQWKLSIRRTLSCISTLDYASLQELKRLFVAVTLPQEGHAWAANVHDVLEGCALPPNALTDTICRIASEEAP